MRARFLRRTAQMPRVVRWVRTIKGGGTQPAACAAAKSRAKKTGLVAGTAGAYQAPLVVYVHAPENITPPALHPSHTAPSFSARLCTSASRRLVQGSTVSPLQHVRQGSRRRAHGEQAHATSTRVILRHRGVGSQHQRAVESERAHGTLAGGIAGLGHKADHRFQANKRVDQNVITITIFCFVYCQKRNRDVMTGTMFKSPAPDAACELFGFALLTRVNINHGLFPIRHKPATGLANEPKTV
ncbi:hypothetical protein GGX14DRAFT_405960 [Mycena pura]|uniref:Uncharacterized protein n=1 Tax=Mycena pura TaxID=153505 RepID=A0AAD6UVE1_9AGAR|nr:hypothetical protein GGX14DRAFT_405960 [Mycena pura]